MKYSHIFVDSSGSVCGTPAMLEKRKRIVNHLIMEYPRERLLSFSSTVNPSVQALLDSGTDMRAIWQFLCDAPATGRDILILVDSDADMHRERCKWGIPVSVMTFDEYLNDGRLQEYRLQENLKPLASHQIPTGPTSKEELFGPWFMPNRPWITPEQDQTQERTQEMLSKETLTALIKEGGTEEEIADRILAKINARKMYRVTAANGCNLASVEADEVIVNDKTVQFLLGGTVVQTFVLDHVTTWSPVS